MRPARQLFPSARIVLVVFSLVMVLGFPAQSSEEHNDREAAGHAVDCLARILHPQPMYSNGRLTGIKLFPNEPSTRQFFASLELRAGDIYDGGGRTPQEEFSRLEAAIMGSNKDPIRLNMLRGDRTIELKIPAARIHSLIEYCNKSS